MLILVRHGETLTNAEGRLLGRADPPLTDRGREQAAALGRGVSPARVISSPLRRAQETAAAFGVAVETDDDWIEIDYGQLEGVALGEVPRETWAAWRADTDFRPPGGETLVEVGERVRRACDELVDAARTDDIVVVSHVSPIKAAVAWALGSGDALSWRLRLSVASICRVAVDGPNPTLVSFNEVGHLS